MKRFRTFFQTMTLGGLVVVLPAFLLFLIFRWLFLWVTDLIQPLTDVVVAWIGAPEFAADWIVILVIIALCFALGVVVKTSVGRFIHRNLETHILSVAPGYRIIKETVMQLLGRKRSPFSSVALVRLYEREGLMTIRSVISCGAGSAPLIDAHLKNLRD